MILSEIFNSSAELNWETPDKAIFNINGEQYAFTAVVGHDRNTGDQVAQIGFSQQYENEFGGMDDDYDLTGDGDSIAVMGTVVNAFNQWLSRNNDIARIWWMVEGNGKGKQKLYDRMAQQFVKSHPEWKFESNGLTRVHSADS